MAADVVRLLLVGDVVDATCSLVLDEDCIRMEVLIDNLCRLRIVLV